MGIHFVNGALVGDGVIDAAKPEALMYEVKPERQARARRGRVRRVQGGVGRCQHAEPPTLFGQTFNVVAAPNRYGIPDFYELHAWAWKENPTGAHQDWNPKVLCPGTEGHTH